MYIISVYVICHYAKDKELALRRLEPRLKNAPPINANFSPKLVFLVATFLHHQDIIVVIGRMIIPGVWMQRGCGECYGGGEGLGPASA